LDLQNGGILMLGSIAGDIIGSVYEWNRIKTKDFPLFQPHSIFTDDSVLTIAIAEAIQNQSDYRATVLKYGRCYPHAGYGGAFQQWLLTTEPEPYESWGNGSAMRVSAVGFAFSDEATVLTEAKLTAAFTHNHPEGIKGAQATALAVFMAKHGNTKAEIRDAISSRFQYDLSRTMDEIREDYSFQVSCQKSVPEAILSFLESSSWEDAIRNAISLGGDSDTLACIAGGIAEAFYRDMALTVLREVRSRLTEELWVSASSFYRKFGLVEINEKLEQLAEETPPLRNAGSLAQIFNRRF
jgi:ADP-ribosylglycohydrolase